MKKFFDVHVFQSRKNGFSVPVAMEGEGEFSDEEVINKAVENDQIDSDDADHVDYLSEIDEFEFKGMGGKL